MARSQKTVSSVNYLETLTMRLAEGLGPLPEAVKTLHVDYLTSQQQPDGGFAGREPGSDLYYTSFALRGLAVSGMLHGKLAERAGNFLCGQLHRELSVVDFLSLLYSQKLLEDCAGVAVLADAAPEWAERVENLLDACRRKDGGYARGPENPRSSTYHTFLILICLELLERSPRDPQATVRFLQSQQRDDGGFVEFAPMRRSGTNPTAAAVGALRLLGELSPSVVATTADFLVEMQTPEGGLRANTRIPIADLLSTFTGLLTLVDLDAQQRIQLAPLAHFVAQLADIHGGFHGALWDTDRDVEYTFYGLGNLALLAHAGQPLKFQTTS